MVCTHKEALKVAYANMLRYDVLPLVARAIIIATVTELANDYLPTNLRDKAKQDMLTEILGALD